MKKITKVGVLSLAKFTAAMYALFGFLAGVFFSIFSALGMKTEAGNLGPAVGMAAVIVFPILYGAMGFVGGLITSVFFNLIAGWLGGIEIEIAEK